MHVGIVGRVSIKSEFKFHMTSFYMNTTPVLLLSRFVSVQISLREFIVHEYQEQFYSDLFKCNFFNN